MSTAISISGVRPSSPRREAMADIWHRCEANGVDIPAEVLAYFNHERPGLHVTEEEIPLSYGSHASHPSAIVYAKGCVSVYLDRLPDGVTSIRVEMR